MHITASSCIAFTPHLSQDVIQGAGRVTTAWCSLYFFFKFFFLTCAHRPHREKQRRGPQVARALPVRFRVSSHLILILNDHVNTQMYAIKMTQMTQTTWKMMIVTPATSPPRRRRRSPPRRPGRAPRRRRRRRLSLSSRRRSRARRRRRRRRHSRRGCRRCGAFHRNRLRTQPRSRTRRPGFRASSSADVDRSKRTLSLLVLLLLLMTNFTTAAKQCSLFPPYLGQTVND